MAQAELDALMAQLASGAPPPAAARAPEPGPAPPPRGDVKERNLNLAKKQMPSKAVSDLDDLLGELKETQVFLKQADEPSHKAKMEKVDNTPPPPPKRAVAAVAGAASSGPSAPAASLDDIDAILGGMNFDANAPDNVAWCAQCKRGITKGTHHLNVGGNKYHNEHWMCGVCAKPLNQDGYYEKGGVIHCEFCYKRKALPQCYTCTQPITTPELLAANGNKFHPNCFTCVQCRKPLGTGAYYYKGGANYCEQHFHDRFDSHCIVCSGVIHGQIVVVRNHEYHPSCFKCNKCQRVISDGRFLDARGMQICFSCDPRGRLPDDGVPTTYVKAEGFSGAH